MFSAPLIPLFPGYMLLFLFPASRFFGNRSLRVGFQYLIISSISSALSLRFIVESENVTVVLFIYGQLFVIVPTFYPLSVDGIAFVFFGSRLGIFDSPEKSPFRPGYYYLFAFLNFCPPPFFDCWWG